MPDNPWDLTLLKVVPPPEGPTANTLQLTMGYVEMVQRTHFQLRSFPIVRRIGNEEGLVGPMGPMGPMGAGGRPSAFPILRTIGNEGLPKRH